MLTCNIFEMRTLLFAAKFTLLPTFFRHRRPFRRLALTLKNPTLRVGSPFFNFIPEHNPNPSLT